MASAIAASIAAVSVAQAVSRCWRRCDVLRPARYYSLQMGFGIRTAPFKIDRPDLLVRTMLMHGVAPQCAVK